MTTTTKAISKVQKVRDLVKSYEGAMARLMPKNLSVERMSQITLINIGRIPKLAECHPATLMGAIMESLRLGLEPGAGPGHTWLIPFFNKRKNRMEVQIIVDYRAIVKRLKTHAGAPVVFAEAVYENDDFEYGVGPKGLYLNWRPASGERGDVVRYFAAAWAKDTTLLGYNVMTAAEIADIRNRSKAKDSGPWKTDPSWMAKKTVVRPLAKLIPHEDDTLSRMGELTDAETFGQPQDLGMLVDDDEIPTDNSGQKQIAHPRRKSEKKSAPEQQKKSDQKPESEPEQKDEPEHELATDKQMKMLFAKFKDSGKSEDDYKAFLWETFGIKTRSKIQKRWVDEIAEWIDAEEVAWPG